MTSWFLGQALLDTHPSSGWWADTERLDTSLAYFCPHCGEVWARRWLSDAPWSTINLGCPKHPYLSDTPGTLIPPWLHTLDGFPPGVLRREFNLRYKEPT